ncbi:MAG: histidinol dehydrogenase, partial [Synergistaceae bacterium]|nr:histidinol dehydrogenase [Synergistaceae bacterium]
MIKIIDAKNFSYNHVKESAHDVSAVVREILDDVRQNGDTAVIKYEKKFDGVELSSLEVSPAEKETALAKVGDEFMKILERAAKNIHEFHSKQVRNGFMFSNGDGVLLGQRVIPLARVGLYVPGGTASYPSSVLMNAIPAKIAGCRE